MRSFKTIVFTFLFVATGINAESQNTGIQFESKLTWEQVKEKARHEGKNIFVDCYATWCGPCKWMSANIFPNKIVGDYFKEHFISVALQMDQTSSDSQEIQDWYGTVASVSKSFNIAEYPTYLFLSPDGQLLHRQVGMVTEPMGFVSVASEAVNPSTQYYAIIDQYKEHLDDSAFLRKALEWAIQESDQARSLAIGAVYFNLIKQPLSKENLEYFGAQEKNFLVTDTKNPIFNLFLNHSNFIDSLMGDGSYTAKRLSWPIFKNMADESIHAKKPLDWLMVKNTLQDKYSKLGPELIVISEHNLQELIKSDIADQAYASGKPKQVSWPALQKSLHKKYRHYDFDSILLTLKCNYFLASQQWQLCEETAYSLLLSQSINDHDLNDIAWYYIFQHGTDKKILEFALTKMQESVHRVVTGNGVNVDTYANLLYKTGHLNDAIEWEKKALALSPRKSGGVYNALQSNLDKMIKKLPTWLDNTPVPETYQTTNQ